MKTFILRKNGFVTRLDSDYKSFGMEPNNLFSPLSVIEKKLQSARNEIQREVHFARADISPFEKQIKEEEKFLKKIRACRNSPEKMLQEFKKIYSEGSIVRNSRGEIDTEATIKKFENHLAEQLRINNRYKALAKLTKEMEQIRKGEGIYARGDVSLARMDIDRNALKQRIEERLQVCEDIVKYWGSRRGGFLATNDKDQIAADLAAIDKAEKFISRAQEILQKLK